MPETSSHPNAATSSGPITQHAIASGSSDAVTAVSTTHTPSRMPTVPNTIPSHGFCDREVRGTCTSSLRNGAIPLPSSRSTRTMSTASAARCRPPGVNPSNSSQPEPREASR